VLFTGNSKSFKTTVTGFRDFCSGLARLNIALRIVMLEIRKMHARTFLGPIWVSVEQLVFTLGYGLFSSAIFGADFLERSTYVGLGLAWFGSVSGLIQGSAQIPELMKRATASSLPISAAFFVHAIRATLLLFFRLAGVAPFVFILAIEEGHFSPFRLLLVLPYVATWLIAAVGTSLVVGALFTRFRDIGPISSVVLQLALFLSPVFWHEKDLRSVEGSASVLAGLQNFSPWAWNLSFLRSIFIFDHAIPVADLLGLTVSSLVLLLVGLVVFSAGNRSLRVWA
jgi:ABC-type polysaccharide/polyol phosphate export permease